MSTGGEGFNIYNNQFNNHITNTNNSAVINGSDHIHDKDNDGAENNHRLLRDDEKCIESDNNQ